MFCVKWLAKLNILVLVSEFVVVVVLSEWWSRPTTADHCGHIPAYKTPIVFDTYLENKLHTEKYTPDLVYTP